jgi:hypothetical protein
LKWVATTIWFKLSLIFLQRHVFLEVVNKPPFLHFIPFFSYNTLYYKQSSWFCWSCWFSFFFLKKTKKNSLYNSYVYINFTDNKGLFFKKCASLFIYIDKMHCIYSLRKSHPFSKNKLWLIKPKRGIRFKKKQQLSHVRKMYITYKGGEKLCCKAQAL